MCSYFIFSQGKFSTFSKMEKNAANNLLLLMGDVKEGQAAKQVIYMINIL